VGECECLTGEPGWPADEAGRLKLWACGGACCDEPKGLERLNELPFWCG
jgi:hypothetical protein